MADPHVDQYRSAMDAPAPRWARFAPGLQVLLHYDRDWLRGDLLAGVTVAAYLIPQVMAYAEIAGLPPITGLWAILTPLLVYALLGSSRQLSVGPESTTALMTAAGLGAMLGAAGGTARWADVAAVMAIAAVMLCPSRCGWCLAAISPVSCICGGREVIAAVFLPGAIFRAVGAPRHVDHFAAAVCAAVLDGLHVAAVGLQAALEFSNVHGFSLWSTLWFGDQPRACSRAMACTTP